MPRCSTAIGVQLGDAPVNRNGRSASPPLPITHMKRPVKLLLFLRLVRVILGLCAWFSEAGGGVPGWPHGLDRCQVTRAVPAVKGRAALARPMPRS